MSTEDDAEIARILGEDYALVCSDFHLNFFNLYLFQVRSAVHSNPMQQRNRKLLHQVQRKR